MKHPKHIAGNIRWNASDDYSDVETVGGWLYCRGAGTRAAFPALTAVGGGLDCSGADTKEAFPALTTVGGCLECVGADTKAAFPALTAVGGWLYCYGADTKAAFPALTAVGGWLYCYGADTRTAFPALTAVGGWLDCHGADIRAAFPALTAVGGWLDCGGADTRAAFLSLVPLLKPGGSIAVWVYEKALERYVGGEVLRRITPRLPRRLLACICRLAVPLYWLHKAPVVGRISYYCLPTSMSPDPEERWLDTFDWYSPRYQWKHTVEEVEGWFREARLTSVVRGSFPVSVRGTRPVS